jgi:hypothetical protein
MKKKCVEMGTITSVGVKTTGLCGGDSGHGGRHELWIEMESGEMGIEYQEEVWKKARKVEQIHSVKLKFGGDWELQAFYGILKVGLEELEKEIIKRHGKEEIKKIKQGIRQSIKQGELEGGLEEGGAEEE